jgi:hypothetical protein
MSTFRQRLCLGVAAAGIFGLGPALATGVAYADTDAPSSASHSTAGKSGATSAAKKAPASRVNRSTATPKATTTLAASATSTVADAKATAAVGRSAVAPTPKPATAASALLTLLPLAATPTTQTAPAKAASGSASAAVIRLRVARAAAIQVHAAEQADGSTQHVLVIGIDGTNLSAILADSYNQNLFDLMDNGTTAASTIVGHTTISNPSWSGILTGVWSETLGVINNVNTPWTYDTWPTIFNQLETYDPKIQTTAIADWANIAQIAGAGSVPADSILYYPKINDSWLDTDDLVGSASVAAIQNTTAGTPSFQFSYFVGVDDTGHEYDAGSPQYADALRNVDDNVGDIMDAVNAWNTANPSEPYTVIVTTDHGQVPWPTIRIGSDMRAHGFQTPWETTTFVIADGPGFTKGAINNTYLNIDVAPTVAALFGLAPEPYSQGTPLMDRSANDYLPTVPGQDGIKQALTDAIAMYGYPDITTNVALVVRTIAATIPYAIFTAFDGLATEVPDFLVFPVQLVGAILYQATNIPAQIIARLTGVTGNQIIPPDLWPYTPIPGTQTETPASTTCASAALSPTCVAV